MNYVDLLVLIVLFLSVWAGIQRGFIVSVLAMLSWVGSLLAGFLLYKQLSVFLGKMFPAIGIWWVPVSFIAVIVLSRWIFDFIVFRIIDKLPYKVQHHKINKYAGIIPGVIDGFIWAVLLSGFLLLMPLNNTIAQQIRNSTMAKVLSNTMAWAENKLSPVFTEALKRAMYNTKTVVSEEAVKLPFTISVYKARPDLEAQMLILVNNERLKNGLKPVKADTEIAVVARKHSADMFKRGYFSHYTPEGKNPFDRMEAGGISFLTAGENLALAQTLSIAHTGLMNSPGHRANILNPSFGRLGIGILDGGIYGLMITQNFRN
jgi:uncharacterized protein YkwD